MVSEQDLGWLAGFFDGEGCISLSRKGKVHVPGVQVVIVNTDKALLTKAQSILDALEIDSTIYIHSVRPSGRKEAFRLQVGSSKGIRRFFAKVPIQSQEKLLKYEVLKSSIPHKSIGHTSARHQRLVRQYPQLL